MYPASYSICRAQKTGKKVQALLSFAHLSPSTSTALSSSVYFFIIHSVNKYVLNSYVPVTELGTGDSTVNKTNTALPSWNGYFIKEDRQHAPKHINRIILDIDEGYKENRQRGGLSSQERWGAFR